MFFSKCMALNTRQVEDKNGSFGCFIRKWFPNTNLNRYQEKNTDYNKHYQDLAKEIQQTYLLSTHS